MQRNRPDHYTQRAHAQGYPARSVFKLEEIAGRFHLLRAGARVLDLGAAPGSWTKFTSRAVGPSGAVVAVDLNELQLGGSGIPENVTFIRGDMFTPEIREAIAALGPFALVLSDAAPSTTGNRTVDTARSAALAEHALEIARTQLIRGGNLVVKLFQGGDERGLLEIARARFVSARLLKPKASRKESFETFLVCIDNTET